MTTPKENALRQEGVNNTFTKRKYNTNIFTQFLHRVKQNLRRTIRSFRKNDAIGATIQFSQEITTPDGVALHVALDPPRVFIADKDGNIVKFSAYLVPELRASLLEVEKKFGRRFIL